jgi:tight adherence protein B
MMTIIILITSFIGVACLVGGVANMLFRPDDGSAIEDRLDILTGVSQGPAARGKNAEASVLSSPLDDMPNAVELLFKRVINLRTFLQQADSPWSPGKFLIISAVMAAVGAAAVVVCRAPVYFAPLGTFAGFLPFMYIYFKRKSRLAKFAKQLPEALELISRALRAGHALASGFKLVADEMGNPIGSEFIRCYEAQNLGQTLEDAIDEMTERVPNLDLRFFATAVILQRQTGGDLAEILDKIGHLVRERYTIYGQIQSLTGEGRLSGIVLLALPPVLFVVMWRLNPAYSMTLFTDPMGHQMLAGAVISQILGAVVIRHIVNIKV